jgi:hypothetical protein
MEGIFANSLGRPAPSLDSGTGKRRRNPRLGHDDARNSNQKVLEKDSEPEGLNPSALAVLYLTVGRTIAVDLFLCGIPEGSS